MTMHPIVDVPSGNVKVDLYAELGITRGTELNVQNLENKMIRHYSDNTPATDETKFFRLEQLGYFRTAGDQYVMVWGEFGGRVQVESI